MSKYLTQTFMSHCNAMICQQVTLSGYAEWPKVADAVIEARLCTGYGTLPVVSAGGAADHRRHHARRGDPENPPASEACRRPTPDCSSACPPSSFRVVLRLSMGCRRPVPDRSGSWALSSRRLVLRLRSPLSLPMGRHGRPASAHPQRVPLLLICSPPRSLSEN